MEIGDKYVASIVLESFTIEAVKVDHVCSDDNLADLLMKGLTRENVYKT